MSKKVKVLTATAVLFAVFAVGAYFMHGYMNRKPVYTGYTTVKSTDRADSKSASYAKFGDGFVRYSKDGIAYYNSDNTPQWNASYELQIPTLDVRGDYCAAAGIGGSWVYVFNKSGAVMSVDTILPIVGVSVAANGCVAVILEDGNTQYIDMYDTTGEKAYRIKTSISGNGVPTDISISDDAVKLMVAYSGIEENEIGTSVIFYNFGEVGKNESERLVGGFDQYSGMLVPMVQFVTADTAIAAATEKLSIYSITQYPKLVADIVYEDELHGIFYSRQYIGLVLRNHEQGYPYRIEVYDIKGSRLGSCMIETDYKEYAFVKDNIFMYDDNDVRLLSFSGTERFRYTFETAIDSLVPVSGDDTYVYINSRKVQKIRLTE